jgi:hypothetical protein
VSCERETLKSMVAEHQIRIMVATDAACEGLNLQTLGHADQHRSALEPDAAGTAHRPHQALRQRRDTVDMLNLVNEQTVDEKIYERLSERMKNRYDLFGSLPDTIKDEWIDDIESLGERWTSTSTPSASDRFRPALHRHDDAAGEGLARVHRGAVAA